MKVAGIIAEYNPFHNGHAYHIEETRKKTNADYIIAVMSGDFVQRGAPAILNKYERARMALENGFDLVIELPVTAALSSAEGFACGGVSLLEKLGVVTDISFGAELTAPEDLALLRKATSVFAAEPEPFRAALSSYLKQGLSFPAARAKALETYIADSKKKEKILNFPESEGNVLSDFIPGTANDGKISERISSPNNILAIEYLKTIEKYGYDLSPCMISRMGNAYHALGLDGAFASATGIRKILLADETTDVCRKPERDNLNDTSNERVNAAEKYALPGKPADINPTLYLSDDIANMGTELLSSDDIVNTGTEYEHSDNLNLLSGHVPASVLRTLAQAADTNSFLQENDFSDMLFYALTMQEQNLRPFGSEKTDLFLRMNNKLEYFETWTQFALTMKSKNQTYTAISRYLAQIMLGITRKDLSLASKFAFAPYARILGFQKSAAPLLKEIQKKSGIPIITRLAKDRNTLEPEQRHLLDLDIRSSALYNHVLFSKSGRKIRSDYRQPLICL